MTDQFRFWVSDKVRWSDLDLLGHVNNTVYPVYLENARAVYFKMLSLKDFWTEETGPVVANIHIDFKAPLHYGDTLEIGVRSYQLSRSSYQMGYVVCRNGKEIIAAEGTTAIVWARFREGRSAPLPEGFKQRLAEYEGFSLD